MTDPQVAALIDLRARVLKAEQQLAQGLPVEDPVSDEELVEALKRLRYDREAKGLSSAPTTRQKKESAKLSSSDFNLNDLFGPGGL